MRRFGYVFRTATLGVSAHRHLLEFENTPKAEATRAVGLRILRTGCHHCYNQTICEIVRVKLVVQHLPHTLAMSRQSLEPEHLRPLLPDASLDVDLENEKHANDRPLLKYTLWHQQQTLIFVSS